MKKKIIIFDGMFLGLLTNELINIFNAKTVPFLYYGVAVIIVLISEFVVAKGIITKNWWKKFVPTSNTKIFKYE